MKSLIRNVKKMRTIELEIKKLEVKIKDFERERENLVDLVIPQMLNNGIQNLKLEGIGTAYISKKESVNVIDVATFHEYLKETGGGDMIKESVNWQTLNGWWSRFDENSRPDLEDIGLGSAIKNTIAIRKS